MDRAKCPEFHEGLTKLRERLEILAAGNGLLGPNQRFQPQYPNRHVTDRNRGGLKEAVFILVYS
jgi:hypothetical protein